METQLPTVGSVQIFGELANSQSNENVTDHSTNESRERVISYQRALAPVREHFRRKKSRRRKHKSENSETAGFANDVFPTGKV